MLSKILNRQAITNIIIHHRTILVLLLLKLGLLAGFIFSEELGTRLLRYFTLEIVLLEAIFLFRNKLLKGVGFLLLLLHMAHLANVLSMGWYVETETILNLNTAAVSSRTIVESASIFLISLVLWLPSIFRRGCLTGGRAMAVLCAILTVCVIGLPRLPLRHVAVKCMEAYEISTFESDLTHQNFFLRNSIASGPVPFSAKDYNIILIFTEGTSSRVLSSELTPHVTKLERRALSFKNYFNHTAATFRGIRGQLISGYQIQGGYDAYHHNLRQEEQEHLRKKLQQQKNSLPNILERYGYSSIFVSPHKQDYGFTQFLEQVGFDTVLAEDKMRSDKELYESLAETAIAAHSEGRKFFLATYPLGTHHGFDSPDLKYGDGSNPYLNKFHNQDHWFGEFLKAIETAGVLENTLLVFTTDHCTYSTPEYRKTFRTDEKYFVDRVPLIIYAKGINPQIFDAKNQNSLSLAPTILNMLSLEKVENHFLGSSLFASTPSEFSHISNLSENYFDTSSGKTVPCEPESDLLTKIKIFFLSFG